VGNAGQLIAAETGCFRPWWVRPIFERILIELGLKLNQDEPAVLRKWVRAGYVFVEGRDRGARPRAWRIVIVQNTAEFRAPGHDAVEHQGTILFQVVTALDETLKQRSSLRIPVPNDVGHGSQLVRKVALQYIRIAEKPSSVLDDFPAILTIFDDAVVRAEDFSDHPRPLHRNIREPRPAQIITLDHVTRIVYLSFAEWRVLVQIVAIICRVDDVNEAKAVRIAVWIHNRHGDAVVPGGAVVPGDGSLHRGGDPGVLAPAEGPEWT
jgi:hypothetical protein